MKYELPLHHGDLVIMRGDTQKKWRHSLPKRLKVKEQRINLTFRFMKEKKPEEELFDLRNDPGEIHNQATNPKYAETMKELRSQLAKWRTTVGDEGVIPEFRAGGWAATYPTRPLAEWINIETDWENYVLKGGKKPTIVQPTQYFPENK